jgi:hypothetical protein
MTPIPSPPRIVTARIRESAPAVSQEARRAKKNEIGNLNENAIALGPSRISRWAAPQTWHPQTQARAVESVLAVIPQDVVDSQVPSRELGGPPRLPCGRFSL